MKAARKTWLATLAMSLANAAKLLAQFAILPVLARLLGPEAYGVVSLAMPFILLANLICDGGLGSALARRLDCDEILESTVFWIALAIGAAMTALMCALAWPAGLLLREPRLTPVLVALSPILLVAAALAPANARVLREQRFGVFACADVASAAIAAVVAIAAAFAGAGLWSLVAQQLTLWGVKAAWVFRASRLLPRFVCRPAAARDLVAFGLNSVGASMSEFVSRNVDNVLVGAFLGVGALGRYAMAYQIIRMPDSIVSGPLYFTIFTSVARAGGDRVKAASIMLSNLRIMAAGIAPLFVGLALVADLGAAVVLGPKWNAAAPLIVRLAPAGALVCTYSFIAATLMGLGKSGRQFRLSLVNGAAVIVAVLIGAPFGVNWAATGVSLGYLAIAPVYLAALKAETGTKPLQVMAAFRGPALAAAVMAVVVMLVRRVTGDVQDLPRLLILAAAGAIAYGAAILPLFGPETRLLMVRVRAGRRMAQPQAPGVERSPTFRV